jgi:hypothetical protein
MDASALGIGGFEDRRGTYVGSCERGTNVECPRGTSHRRSPNKANENGEEGDDGFGEHRSLDSMVEP